MKKAKNILDTKILGVSVESLLDAINNTYADMTIDFECGQPYYYIISRKKTNYQVRTCIWEDEFIKRILILKAFTKSEKETILAYEREHK